MNSEQSARFWAKVKRGAKDECWPWLASKAGGYGRFCISGRIFQAHRLAFEESGQTIPAGLVLDHKCRNRGCVNPNHLRPVTRLVNVHENSDAVAYHNSLRTHCRQGHAFEGDNLFYKEGRRQCRECQRKWRRASEAKARLGASHESPVGEADAPVSPSSSPPAPQQAPTLSKE